MGNEEKISIIITSYNYAQYIAESIESVINQTYKNWELIIVDDASSDNSVEIIKKFCEKDSRIKLYENSHNKGLKDSLLLGIEKATYDWLSFLESDDFYETNYLEEKIKTLQKYPDADLIFNDVEIFGDKGEMEGLNDYFEKRDKILKNGEIKYKDLLAFNLITSFSCVMVKKSVIKSCCFDCPQTHSLDFYLWTQLYKNAKVLYLPQKLTHWRKHFKNYTKKAASPNQAAFDLGLLKILTDKDSNKFLIALYGFIRNVKIKKLFNPQITYLSNLIIFLLFKNKTLNITIV